MEETKKGTWTSEDESKLVFNVQEHGTCKWTAVPKIAGIHVFFLLDCTINLFFS